MAVGIGMTIRFRTDTQWFRSASGTSLIAGSPLSFFKVSDKGAAIITHLENNDVLPDGHEALTQRLIAAGALHPFVETSAPLSLVTVVIPTFIKSTEDALRLHQLVDSFTGARVIVVDDCSPIPITIDNATLVRHDKNLGPGAARNTGLALVDTPFVAFADDDVLLTPDCVGRLVSQFTHDNIALVAPRIVSSSSNSSISEYESHHSPLDLGRNPSLIRPFSRVSYVPAAMFVCRTSVARQLGGFNTAMRMGEDVDFVWRLVDAGFTCRYEPELSSSHLPRSTWKSFIKQRFGYGTSAAPLSTTHKKYVSPLRANIVLLFPAVSLISGYLLVFLLSLPLVFAWYVITLHRSGLSVSHRLRITAQGELATIRLLASAVARAWWPIAVVLAFVWNGASFALAVSLLCPALFGVFRNKPKNIAAYMTLRVLDNLSYGAGVWWGAFTSQSVRCLVPAITRSPLRLRSKG